MKLVFPIACSRSQKIINVLLIILVFHNIYLKITNMQLFACCDQNIFNEIKYFEAGTIFTLCKSQIKKKNILTLKMK